jgi:hypothetical protein
MVNLLASFNDMQPMAAGPRARIRRRPMSVVVSKGDPVFFASRGISNRNWKELKTPVTLLKSDTSSFLIAVRTGVSTGIRGLKSEDQPLAFKKGEFLIASSMIIKWP